MKKKLSMILIVILIVAGLSLLLYPYISNEWNTYRQSKLITTYNKSIEQKEKEVGIDYQDERSNAEAYNDNLFAANLPDAFARAAVAEKPDEAYMAALNLNGDGMMGYIEIPKIDIKLPIYHTVNEEVLQIAAGHLEGSSLPVGGAGTHTVISAHRGLPSADLFTNLDKVALGDHFLIYVLDEVLCYEVDQIITVLPSQTEELLIQEGQDLATLFTCTPYGVNSHRLLVRGHRVEYVEEVVMDEHIPLADIDMHTNYLMWLIPALIVIVVVISALAVRDKRLRRRAVERNRVIDIIENDKIDSKKE